MILYQFFISMILIGCKLFPYLLFLCEFVVHAKLPNQETKIILSPPKSTRLSKKKSVKTEIIAEVEIYSEKYNKAEIPDFKHQERVLI